MKDARERIAQDRANLAETADRLRRDVAEHIAAATEASAEAASLEQRVKQFDDVLALIDRQELGAAVFDAVVGRHARKSTLGDPYAAHLAVDRTYIASP